MSLRVSTTQQSIYILISLQFVYCVSELNILYAYVGMCQSIVMSDDDSLAQRNTRSSLAYHGSCLVFRTNAKAIEKFLILFFRLYKIWCCYFQVFL